MDAYRENRREAWLPIAQLTALMANVHRDKRHRTFKPEEFLPAYLRQMEIPAEPVDEGDVLAFFGKFE